MKLKVADNIESLVAYPPGKPIEELERELGIEGSIKLASNENPLGPSPKAVEALKNATLVEGLNRYPDGSCFYLKRRLAEFLDVDIEMLSVGNGSNEIIELLIKAFVSKGDEVLMADPSFAVYQLVVQAFGGTSVKVDLNDSLTIDLLAMAKAITYKTRLVFISNPNNPTGTIVTEEDFRGFMDKVPEGVIVCMDEAYFEYVADKSSADALSYVKQGKAVIVLRTFSKVYGLPGLRVGYGVAPKEIIGYLEKVRQPFNVNSLAQSAALAAIDDSEHVERSRACNAEGIRYLFGELSNKGFECVPTEANFFLVKVGDGLGVYDALLKRGVIVRPMKGYGLPEYIRITVGTMKENKRFLDEFFEVTAKITG